MLTENAIILKEWAAVCQALLSGEQSILLRKGGIAEGAGGFAMEHSEFWLLPTYLHQSAEQLTPAGAALLPAALSVRPPAGRLSIDTYLTVDRVWFVRHEQQLAALRPFHVLSDVTVAQRFHYRQPGLYVAAVQVFRSEHPWEFDEDSHLAGCKSWGELSSGLLTTELIPMAQSGRTKVLPILAAFFAAQS
jgi:hypothetical protein